DARTLRWIERPGPASESTVTVRDAMSAIGTMLRRAPKPPAPPMGEAKVAAEPLDGWTLGATGVRAPEPASKGAHAKVLEAIREREPLPSAVPLQVLAWRDVTAISRGYDDAGRPVETTVRRHDVVGFVEQRIDADTTRWVLFKGSM